MRWDLKMQSSISMNWKAFYYGMEVLRKGVVVDVKNGLLTNFWQDEWLSIGPLLNFSVKPLELFDLNLCNFWVSRVGWNWSELQLLLPPEILYLFNC